MIALGIVRGGVVTAAAALSLAVGYLLVLLGAATTKRPPRPGTSSPPTPRLHFTILIPAHNEESGIEATLASVRRLDYPEDQYDVVVIADNCQDHTADVAREAGAKVLERFDSEKRGKGYALAWAQDHLLTSGWSGDAVVVIDADCSVSPNLLTAIAGCYEHGATIVQVANTVANPDESWSSALRYAAFSLMNIVRPLGKTRLGFSAGLLGTGMSFCRSVLERYPWQAFSVTEDVEFHFQLINAGQRVAFAPEAVVSSAMPTSLRESYDQQLRWEGGGWAMLRMWMPVMLKDGLRRRDPERIHAALESLVFPQTLLLAANMLLGATALLTRSRRGVRLSLVNLLGQAVYIVGGLWLVRAPAVVYRALALAPVLALWKLGLFVRIFFGRGPTTWTRGTRHQDQASIAD